MSLRGTRREFLLASLGVMAASCAPSRSGNPPVAARGTTRSLEDVEARVGGRVGVFALDTGNGRQLGHRQDERFAMCSTFKWVLAAAVLAQVDRGELSLAEEVAYGQADLLEYAPVTRMHVAEGFMTVDALTAAIVTVSDNTAANLLLARVGGPEGLTRFTRALGDPVTRLDRNEPSLNSNEAPQDPRDTTSPRAMVGLMRNVLCGEALSPASRSRLLEWLRASETGLTRLRAGLPGDWVVGDKTGTGRHGAVNDVAIALPPGRAPILVAMYMSESQESVDVLSSAHADVGRIIARSLL